MSVCLERWCKQTLFVLLFVREYMFVTCSQFRTRMSFYAHTRPQQRKAGKCTRTHSSFVEKGTTQTHANANPCETTSRNISPHTSLISQPGGSRDVNQTPHTHTHNTSVNKKTNHDPTNVPVLFFTSLEEVDAADALTRDRRETRELTPLRLHEDPSLQEVEEAVLCAMLVIFPDIIVQASRSGELRMEAEPGGK